MTLPDTILWYLHRWTKRGGSAAMKLYRGILIAKLVVTDD